MKFVPYYIVLFLTFAPLQAQSSLQELLKLYNTHSVPYISVEELRMYQANSAVHIFDARELEEYEVSKIPSAAYIGFNEFSSEKTDLKVDDKNSMIVVYCSLGIRSEQIAEKLQQAGYTNVKNLYGGIFEWKNKGYPVFNSEGKETESVHVFSRPWSKWLLKGIKVY
jgi:rhodanese-related sulfurtransferase